ncbi:hypothetical protein DL546_004700 [Coniochaeta pulveracea]|uniref:Decapping nuclease n=1 Tax=Coniochaeta pulveracea TaxID=177199 RepID=A0A420Y0Y0_9PEZI|nr:hypothetical protein DL546_004700 [Coniochaeta pulveracea]
MSILAKIPFSSLASMPLSPDASITDFRHLASYNWIDSITPTIAVPGSPDKWSPPSGPTRLKKDTGYFYTAQNAARHPDSPLEPLFRALLLTHPSFDLRSIDIVTDRNNLRKLLSFVDPGSAKYGAEDFTIQVEVIGETVVFCRRDAEVMQYIAPNEFRGYGHEFEKAYTTSQVKDSTGHHRIVEYRFGGLKFLVRYEVDGYVSPTGKSDAAPKSWPGSKLKVTLVGKPVPPEQCLEIKTRVAHKPLQMQDVMPQLWVSQTTKLVRACHSRGVFQPPLVEDVTDAMKRWETDHTDKLRKLAAVIAEIAAVAKRSGGPVLVKYSVAGNQLVLSSNDAGKMLPNDLYGKWKLVTEKEEVSPAKTQSMGSDGKGTKTVRKGAASRR